MNVQLITGGRDAGKTAYLLSLAEQRPCSGILSAKHFAGGEHRGYNALFYRTGTFFGRMPFLRLPEDLPPGGDWFAYRRYSFNSDVFRAAVEDVGNWTPPVIIDEIGPLEMDGRGFAGILRQILESGMGAGGTAGGKDWQGKTAGAGRRSGAADEWHPGDSPEPELYLSVRPSLLEDLRAVFGLEEAALLRLDE